jgi:hypothetical protein
VPTLKIRRKENKTCWTGERFFHGCQILMGVDDLDMPVWLGLWPEFRTCWWGSGRGRVVEQSSFRSWLWQRNQNSSLTECAWNEHSYPPIELRLFYVQTFLGTAILKYVSWQCTSPHGPYFQFQLYWRLRNFAGIQTCSFVRYHLELDSHRD